MFTKDLKPGDWVVTTTKFVGRVADTSLMSRGKIEVEFMYDRPALEDYLTPYFGDKELEPIPFIDADLVKVYRMPDNNLLMVLTEEGRAELPAIKKNKEGIENAIELELLERFSEIGWEVTNNISYWGHMSSAPALTDQNGWDYPDYAEGLEVKYLWYDPNYAIRWWVAELEKNGYFVWTYFNAESDKDEH